MNQTTETRPRHAGIYDELLQPGPLALETGVHRLDDGRLLVAVRTSCRLRRPHVRLVV